MVAGTAATLGFSRVGLGQQAVAPGGPVRVERQPTGSEIWQVTHEQFMQTVIYCEISYGSRDSRYFVYQRKNPKLPGKNHTEFMVVEMGTWKQHRLDVSIGTPGCAMSHNGVFYYLKHTGGDALDLMRADLVEGKPQKVYRLERERLTGSLGTVTTDGRYYARGVCPLDDQWKTFGIRLVDLEQGQQKILDQDPFIFNAHPQLEPGEGKTLMVQQNRGSKFSPEGKRLRSCGPEGATLYLVSVPGGKRTPLEVGKPHTAPISGHQAWIGTTKEILLTAGGNLLAVRAGEPTRVVVKETPYRFYHIGSSRCGRLFCCGDRRGGYNVVIGSPQTGETARICDAKTKTIGPPRTIKNTHPRPYLMPDLKWVIFQSNRTGWPHIYAARVPEGIVEELLEV